MYFQSFAEFLDMGGYAFYVWGAFLLTWLSVGIFWGTIKRQRRTILREVIVYEQRQHRRRIAKQSSPVSSSR